MVGYWIVISLMIIAIVAVLLAVRISPESDEATGGGPKIGSADGELSTAESPQAAPEPPILRQSDIEQA